MTGDQNEARLLDAWLEGVLEEQLGGAPDVVGDVLAKADEARRVAPDPGSPTPPRRTTVVLLALGVAAAALILFWSPLFSASRPSTSDPGDGAPVEAQDPQDPAAPVDVELRSLEQVLALAKDIEAVRLTLLYSVAEQRTLADGTVVASAGWAPIPTLSETVPVDSLRFAVEPSRPLGRAAKFPIRCDLMLSGNRRVRGHLELDGRPYFGSVSLPIQVSLDVSPLESAIERLEGSRAEAFGLVGSVEDLAAVPRTVQSLVCCELGDVDLRPLSRFEELRSLRIRAPSTGWPTGLIRNGSREPEPLPVTDRGLAFLAGMPKLERLELRGVSIGDTTLKLLAKLPRLRHLRIEADARASLTGTGFSAFSAREGRLRRLEVAGCERMTVPGLLALGRVATTDLTVRFSPGQSVPHAGLWAMLASVEAEFLTLESAVLGPGCLDLPRGSRSHHSLRAIRLVGCVNADLTGIEKFLRLGTLQVEDGALAERALRMLVGARLSRLDLVRCKSLAPGDLEAVVALPTLRALSLVGLSAAVPWNVLGPKLGAAKHLRELDLRHCALPGNVILEHAPGWRHLETLDLRGNVFSAEECTAIHTALPDTLVVYPDARPVWPGQRRGR